MVRYRETGTERALAMDNRGPIRFGADGALDPAILESYARHGFYVFEGVLGEEGQLPPVNVSASSTQPPSLGYPIPVRDDGTLPLPLVDLSVNDLLGFATDFALAIEAIQLDPAASIQGLEDLFIFVL